MTSIQLKCVLPAIILFAGGVPCALAQQSSDTPPDAAWAMADEYWGAEQMAIARKEVQSEGGDQRTFYVLFNQLEAQSGGAEDTFYWNGMANWGGDVHKLWLKTEGKASLTDGGVEDAEIQGLYSRAVAPFWNIQGGIRYDIEPDSVTHGVIALNGLAPYWFEVDASAFVSERGDITARFEAEYELFLTQRLILQPRIEANLSAQDIPERQTGSGLNSLDAGVRLRYEIRREFAPYIGVEWQGNFGGTKDFIEAAGGDGDQVVAVVGVRTWF